MEKMMRAGRKADFKQLKDFHAEKGIECKFYCPRGQKQKPPSYHKKARYLEEFLTV